MLAQWVWVLFSSCPLMPATLGLYVRNREKHTDRERKKGERTTKVICNGGFNVLNKSVSMLINNQMAAF